MAMALAKCPYCTMEMLATSVGGHVATCKEARRVLENKKRENKARGVPIDSGPALFKEEKREDGHTSCKFCGRFFVDDRIHQHVAICCRLRQARPASIGGVQTMLPGRIYNSAAARQGAQRVGCYQRLFIPRAQAESSGVLVRCAGAARKIGSRAAATIRPWTVLGVSRRGSLAEVRAAYKKLALQWHPDRHPEEQKAAAEVQFKAVTEAHDAMTRPWRRRRQPGRGQLALVDASSWREKRSAFLSAVREGRSGAAGLLEAGVRRQDCICDARQRTSSRYDDRNSEA